MPLLAKVAANDHVVHMCYTSLVSDTISVRELRNRVSELLRRVEAGERLTVTVDRRPVAELVPLRRPRVVSMSQARMVAQRHPADRRLLADIGDAIPDTTDDA